MAPRALAASLLVGLLLMMGGSAAAQQLPPRLAQAAPLDIPPRRLAPADTAPRRDYRWLGTAIGAAGLGLVAGLEASAYCGNSEKGPRNCTGLTMGVGLLGAAVGGAVGHLVGRAIHR